MLRKQKGRAKIACHAGSPRRPPRPPLSLKDALFWARENQLKHDDLRTSKSAKAIEQIIIIIFIEAHG